MRRPGIEVLWGALAGLVALLIARMLLLYIFPPPPGVNLACLLYTSPSPRD